MTTSKVQQSRATQNRKFFNSNISIASYPESLENPVQPVMSPQSPAAPSLSEKMGRFYGQQQKGQSPAPLNPAGQSGQDQQESKPAEKSEKPVDAPQKGASNSQVIDPKSNLSPGWLATQTLINSGRNIVRIVPAINGGNAESGNYGWVNGSKGVKSVFSIAMAANGIWEFRQIGNDDAVAKSAAGHNAAIGSTATMRSVASTSKGFYNFRNGAVSLVRTDSGLKLVLEAAPAKTAVQTANTLVTTTEAGHSALLVRGTQVGKIFPLQATNAATNITISTAEAGNAGALLAEGAETAGNAGKLASITGTAAARTVGIVGSIAIATLQADAAQENYLHSDKGPEAKKERAAQVASALTMAGMGATALIFASTPIAKPLALLGLALGIVYVVSKIKTGKGFDPVAELYKVVSKLENFDPAVVGLKSFLHVGGDSLSDKALGEFAEFSHKAITATGLGEYLHRDEIEKLAKTPAEKEATSGKLLSSSSTEQTADAAKTSEAGSSLSSADAGNGNGTGPDLAQAMASLPIATKTKSVAKLSAQKASVLKAMSENAAGATRKVTVDEAEKLKLRFEPGSPTKSALDALEMMKINAGNAFYMYQHNPRKFYAIGRNGRDAEGNPAFYHYLPDPAQLAIFDKFYPKAPRK